MKELFIEIEKLSIQFKRQNEEEVKRIKKNKVKVIITTTKKSPHQPKSNVVKSQGVGGISRPKQVAFISQKPRWIPKTKSLVAHTTLTAGKQSRWYLDSGCSRHVTSDRSHFSELPEFDGGTVTFGDSSVARIVRKGTLKVPKLPVIEDVLCRWFKT